MVTVNLLKRANSYFCSDKFYSKSQRNTDISKIKNETSFSHKRNNPLILHAELKNTVAVFQWYILSRTSEDIFILKDPEIYKVLQEKKKKRKEKMFTSYQDHFNK